MRSVGSRPRGRTAPVNGTSYHYLGQEDENAARCSGCGSWATDTDRSEWIDCINRGSVIEGRFLCEQCRVYLIHEGVLPDPALGHAVEPDAAADGGRDAGS